MTPQAVVAVLTYRRAHLLPRLLEVVAGQADAVPDRVGVVVVDNDPDGSAAGVVGGWAERGVRYVHEPRPGISAARNRALDEAGAADVLVFLDDDELPSEGWLEHLLTAWRDWGCAAVVGPVPSVFLAEPEPWVAGSGVFDPRRRPTGTAVGGAGAGNLLLDLRQVRALGLRFDPRLSLTGGEDTMFTHQLVHRGGQIRWCDEAEAVEFVPAERLTRRWVRRRSFRAGSSWSRAEVSLAAGAAGRARLRAVLLGRAGAHLLLAAGRWTAGLLRHDPAACGAAACTAAGYCGLVAGAFGHVPVEYARSAVASPSREEQHVVTG